MKTEAQINSMLQTAIHRALTNPQFTPDYLNLEQAQDFLTTNTIIETLYWVLTPYPNRPSTTQPRPPRTSFVPTPNYN